MFCSEIKDWRRVIECGGAEGATTSLTGSIVMVRVSSRFITATKRRGVGSWTTISSPTFIRRLSLTCRAIAPLRVALFPTDNTVSHRK